MRKIVFSKKRVLSQKELFEEKERFHKELAKLPFEEKIKILGKLQRIAKEIKKASNRKTACH
jgi:hypothetical protein